MSRATTMMLLLGPLALFGCKEEKGAAGPSGGGDKPAATFQQAPLDQLREAGLKVGDFETAAAEPYQARGCVRGKVEQLDVLLCQYATSEAAEAARAKLQGFASGAVTGAIRLRAGLALAVADREKIDLKGARINRLLGAFVGKPPAGDRPAVPPKAGSPS